MTRRSPDDLRFNVRLGSLIKSIRTDQGIGQTELAQRIGTGQSAISEIETGLHGPTAWLLRRIAHGLGYELRIVFERKNYETT